MMRVLTLVLLLSPSVAVAQASGADGARRVSPMRPDPMVPAHWAEARGPECDTRGAHDRVCDGPRRVPVATAQAAERAERLGLGTRTVADRMLIGTPPSSWVEAIPSDPRDDLLWPVARGLFSRGFGYVRREEIRDRRHDGVDIVAREGAHIRAANDGLVAYADNGVRGYGNLLILLHADGTVTLYAHCRAIYVAPGQLVARGQAVAEVGATGRPYVAHLHFEWRRSGHPRDPADHFVERPDYHDIRPHGGRDFDPPPPNVVDPPAARDRGHAGTSCASPPAEARARGGELGSRQVRR